MPVIDDAPRRFDFLGTRTQLLLWDHATILVTDDPRIQEIIGTAFVAERGLRITCDDTSGDARISDIALAGVKWNGIVRATAADLSVTALEPGPVAGFPVTATLSQNGKEVNVTANSNAYEILRVAFRLQAPLLDPGFNAAGDELTHGVIQVSEPPAVRGAR